MKNFTFFIATLFVAGSSIAQVHVVNDAFIYSKGTDIFITQGLELRKAPVINATTEEVIEPGSAFYLREGANITGDGNGQVAQLIQGGTGSPNTGAGTFSVFQEGAANNFTYNYWSSPVSEPGAGANAGFKNTQIYFPLLTQGFSFETDFVIDARQASILAPNVRDGRTDNQEFTDQATETGPTIVNEKLRIASRWLYSYNSADPAGTAGGQSGYFGWKPFQTSTDVIAPGYGFTMKGVIISGGVNLINSPESPDSFGQRYDFRGIPNNGNIPVAVANGDFSLVGNPYPSALDLKAFMGDIDNQGLIDGQLFFWDSASTTHILVEYLGGYGTYSPDLSNPSSDGFYVDPVFRKYDASGILIEGSGGSRGGLSGPVGDADNISRRYAAIGQGFVIQRTDSDDPSTPEDDRLPDTAINPSGTVIFKNSHRVFQKEDGDTSLFKAAPSGNNDQTRDENSRNLNPAFSFEVVLNKQYSRNMIVSFSPRATKGWDWGMDASNIANRTSNDAYMKVGGRQALIQTLPYEDTETSIPLAFKSNDATSTFEVRVNGLENFSPEQILLHDKQTDTYHDILNDSYTMTTGKGTVADRYEIVFEEKSTLSNVDELLASDAFNIFQNNERSLLTIQNPAGKNVSDISVFDLAGRLVASQNPKEANQEFTFNTSSYSAGIYIVKVSTPDDEELAKKVIISN